MRRYKVLAGFDRPREPALFPKKFQLHRWEASRVYLEKHFKNLGMHALWENESLNKRSHKVVFSDFKACTQTHTDGLAQTFEVIIQFWLFCLAYAYCEEMDRTLWRGPMQRPHFRVCFVRVQQVGRRRKANNDQCLRQRKN